MNKISPLCPYFADCNGCQYQDISYQDELLIKHDWLIKLVEDQLCLSADIVDEVVASPQEYHYRQRLDLRMLRTKQKTIHIGFTRPRQPILEIVSCAIARQEISDYIPQLKQEAIEALPEKYRLANLTVRSGDAKRVQWGGIGKGSLKMKEKDFFWTQVNDKRIFYSLDTFFQANLFILPALMERIKAMPIWNKDALFFDLYGGVGLFGICLSDMVKEVCLVEENPHSTRLAEHNSRHNQLDNFQIYSGRVEDVLDEVLSNQTNDNHIVMVDPPRAGLSDQSVDLLNGLDKVKYMLYLSCNPETLVPNLAGLTKEKWQIEQIIPVDFFPRTKHLEVLTVLSSTQSKEIGR